MKCAHCHTQNSVGSRFCSGCGARLSEVGPAPERRSLTVVFCDLIGSTSLAQALDPEDWREVLLEYQSICAEVVKRFDGFVAQYLGDGLLIYFGYPQAHEDSARRAVMASLGIIRAIAEPRSKTAMPAGKKLAVRIGAHTGMVVVAEMGAGGVRELSAQGAVPNVAARLQSLAHENSVVISRDTFRLVEGFFRCRALGPHTIKGVETPVEIFEVLAEEDRHNDLAGRKGQGNLIGRHSELETLQQAWRETKSQGGRVIHLLGEPGIGKSRLTRGLQEYARSGGATLLTVKCSAYHQASALFPIVELFERLLRFQPTATAAQKLTQIEQFLAVRQFSAPQTVPLLADLLGVAQAGKYEPLMVSPELRRQRTAQLLVALLFHHIEAEPALFTAEDLHWADPSTLSLLEQVVSQLAGRRLLLLCTFRPQFQAAWASRPEILTLRLERLAAGAVTKLIAQVCAGQPLPEAVVNEIIHKSDGNPLFVEEITKAVLENAALAQSKSGAAAELNVLPMEIPASLNDSLMARLDRLSTVKTVAQICSVFGREFSFEMAEALCGIDRPALRDSLDRLMGAELIFPIGDPAYDRYAFKHALIQEAAYQSMLKSARREYHRRVAELVVQRFPDWEHAHPEYVAEHFAAAGEHARAIQYWIRAAQSALQRSANLEAVAQSRAGLALIEKLPASPQRDELELSLLSIWGVGIVVTRGFAAPEVGEVYLRAGVLWRRLGSKPEYCTVLWGMWVFYLVRSELDKATAIAGELLAIGRQADQTSIEIEGYWTLADSQFWAGNLASAHENLERALELYDPEKHHQNAWLYGQDPGVASLCYHSFVLWHRGFPERAVGQAQAALALAHRLKHPFSIGWALGFLGMLKVWSYEIDAALEIAEQTILHCGEQVQPFWLFAAFQYRGWALVQKGDFDSGLKLLAEGLQGYQAIGSITVQPFFLGLQAEAAGRAGNLGPALVRIDEALLLAQNSGQKVSEGELHRLKGELLQKAEPVCDEAVQACFETAIQHARQLQAPMRELQARTSLAAFQRSRNPAAPAQPELAAMLSRFTEGHDHYWLKLGRAHAGALPGETLGAAHISHQKL